MVRIAGGLDLKVYRTARGLSQAALAAAVGVRPLVVARWERGESVPTDAQVEGLAQALDVEPLEVSRWFEGVARGAGVATPSGGDSSGRGADPWTSRASPDRSGRGGFLRSRLRMLRIRPPSGPGGAWAFPSRSSRRVVRSYLNDPVERRRYALRLAATILVMLALMLALVWALGQLSSAWGSFLDLFRDTEPSTSSQAAVLLPPIW